ncbi:hypothetical protein AAMO2058_001703800 [Amorphochlora amoebiformis]
MWSCRARSSSSKRSCLSLSYLPGQRGGRSAGGGGGGGGKGVVGITGDGDAKLETTGEFGYATASRKRKAKQVDVTTVLIQENEHLKVENKRLHTENKQLRHTVHHLEGKV